MKARLNMSFAIAGIALILLTGCVSSRKYKASEAALAKARNDSAQLAQQVTALNSNVHDLQDKNTGLQRSLESSSTSYAAQQKSLDYYQGYFKTQQDTLAQVSQDVKGALTQAGIANGDVQQMNNCIYVRFDENEVFKKNSTVVTPVGKQVLDGLAQVISGRTNVNVAVGSGDSAVGWVATNNMPADAAMSTAPKHHHRVHANHSSMSSSSSGGSASNGTGGGSTAANTNGADSKSDATPTHKKVHHKYSSEGSMAIYNGPGHMHNRAWALKQGRMVAVADHFLKNGLPKINLSLQQPPMNGAPQSTDIKIIITPKMDNFNPQSNTSAAVGIK
jgi:outer membrane protein OmpA-like peptidoglycan-associated protein